MVLDVTEYRADVYYNSKTGERVHAPFPAGVVNDVNYDGSIKAFLFLLNNECCVSIDKSRKFLSDLTNGKLKISRGMINNLSKEFSRKTADEQKELFLRIIASPVMHIDCTNARVNGKNAYVFVTATPDGEAMYFARAKRGMKVSGVLRQKTIMESLSRIMKKPFINMVLTIRSVSRMWNGI